MHFSKLYGLNIIYDNLLQPISTFRHSDFIIIQFLKKKKTMFLNLNKSLVPYAMHFVPYVTDVLIHHSSNYVSWVMLGMNFNLGPTGKYIDLIAYLK